MDLKTARFFQEYTQWDLSVDTGINQARISLGERGKLVLNEDEKKKIVNVLGVGYIDWEATENQLGDFKMPKVDIGEPQVGIKVQVSKDPDELPCPKVLHISAEENTSLFRYLTWDEFLQEK